MYRIRTIVTAGKRQGVFKVRCIMVSSDRATSAAAVQFFNSTYNIPGAIKPHFLNLFFYHIQTESNNREPRIDLVRRHKLFAEQERKLLVCGFLDLDTPLTLQNGGQPRSGRQLMMGQRVLGNPQQFVFHGIDRNNADTTNVFFRFAAEHQDDAKQCLAHLEARLRQVVHPNCYHMLFCNKNDVLTYPGRWPLTNIPEAPLPIAISEDDVMLHLVRRPILPAVTPATFPTQEHTLPAAHTARGAPQRAQVSFAPPTPMESAEPHAYSASTTSLIPYSRSGDNLYSHRLSRKPAKCARTSFAITQDTDMIDVSSADRRGTDSFSLTTAVPMDTAAGGLSLPDVAMREANARIASLHRHHRSTKRVLKKVIYGLEANTDNISDMQHNIQKLTGMSTAMLSHVQSAYGNLQRNPQFYPESDGEFSL
jgi:hypothetical protein